MKRFQAYSTFICLCFYIFSSVGIALAQQPPSTDSTPSNSNLPVIRESASALRELINRIIVFLSGEPFDTEAEIDRIVGDPLTLEGDTLARINTLPSRLRFQLFSALTQRWTSSISTPAYGDSERLAITNPTGPLAPGWSLTLDSESGRRLLWTLLDAAEAHFTTEQLIDLTVFAMHRIGIGPRDRSRWQTWKRYIIRSEVELALSFILIQALLNQGQIRFSGNIVNLSQGIMRLGWYAGIRQFGIELNPRIAAGLQLNSRFLEVITGIVYQANALSNAEVLGYEATLRSQWSVRGSGSSRWEFTALGRARYSIIHNNVNLPSYAMGEVEFFVQRPTTSQRIPVDLFINAAGSTDFLSRFQSRLALGIESAPTGTTGVAQFSIGNSPEQSSALNYQFGLFGAGSLESQRNALQTQLSSIAFSLRRSVNIYDWISRTENEINEYLRIFGTRASTIESERETISLWRYLIRTRDQLNRRVSMLRSLYRDKLQEYYQRFGRPNPNFPLETQGPLDPEIIQRLEDLQR